MKGLLPALIFLITTLFLVQANLTAQEFINIDGLQGELDEAQTLAEDLENAEYRMKQELGDVDYCMDSADCATELEEAQEAAKEYETIKEDLEMELEDLDRYRY